MDALAKKGNLIYQIQYDKPNPFSLSNFKKQESAVAIKPTTALTANARSSADDAHDYTTPVLLTVVMYITKDPAQSLHCLRKGKSKI